MKFSANELSEKVCDGLVLRCKSTRDGANQIDAGGKAMNLKWWRYKFCDKIETFVIAGVFPLTENKN